ncbi:MAG TPA: EAL domain-containing response regulator [Woeseiaceae bacterium]|nr:EAL domain-containing response regulator [Woeseiaceae bacterium]
MSKIRSAAARLLVLDDDVELGELIGELGRRSGFDAAVTHDAAAFNEELGRAAPDLIVLDLQMPNTDGVEILKDLAAGGTGAGILLVSGMDNRTIAGAEHFGRNAGLRIVGTLQKPFTPETMLARLSSAHESTRRLTSEDLARAIEQGELALRYQPVVRRLRSGAWHAESVEALLRWEHPSLGLLVPSQFLSLIDSDRGELMKQMTDFVFERGIEQLRVWQADGFHIGLRVNVAAGLIADAGFPDRLEALLNEHETDPELLTLEIREAADLGLSTKGADILTRLRLKSIKLALDDFGGPGSTLNGWYTLPFGELKIDRCLTADLGSAAGAATVVGGLVEIAHRLEMGCCAVGVETLEQLNILDELQCDLAQGFYIGAPLPAARLPQALDEWTAELATESAEGAAR